MAGGVGWAAEREGGVLGVLLYQGELTGGTGWRGCRTTQHSTLQRGVRTWNSSPAAFCCSSWMIRLWIILF